MKRIKIFLLWNLIALYFSVMIVGLMIKSLIKNKMINDFEELEDCGLGEKIDHLVKSIDNEI